MRIIAGEGRGRKLFAPEGLDTRPTTDRIRESIFNILMGCVPGARVLDLFSGSGALGLESLSRGADFAVMNDPARAAADCIERNVRLTGWGDRCRILRLSYRDALARLAGESPFSLVFLDPPYRMTETYAQVADDMARLGLLTPDATIVMEHSAKLPLVLPEGFCVADKRRYGETAVAFVQKEAVL